MARTRAGVASSPAPASWPQSLAKSWQVEVGIGYSTPVVQGERVFQLSRQGENEVVRALKISTGATLWEHSYDAPYIMNPAASSHGKGPKSTPLVVHPVPTPAGILVKDESKLALWKLEP